MATLSRKRERVFTRLSDYPSHADLITPLTLTGEEVPAANRSRCRLSLPAEVSDGDALDNGRGATDRHLAAMASTRCRTLSSTAFG